MYTTINIVLFPYFETLDVFGPVEVFGKADGFFLEYFSLAGGIISNNDNIKIETKPLNTLNIKASDILFVPGGMGTRKEIDNQVFISKLKELAESCRYVLTVCTGSALLAKTGLLDHKNATSNKRAFEWVKESRKEVEWIREARWVNDGKFYTSSGVSAGIDMALGFISDMKGIDEARRIAYRIEYEWQEDNTKDKFCNQ
ncbi:MAG: DJ-1/PfpI family protein [Prevotella sp.]|jgi:putative intracellular protease/amidase|nr:DJ-1/PfpI family protein [Prevotella sp.]